jgi:hypothetical protein
MKFQDEGPRLRRKYLTKSACHLEHPLEKSSKSSSPESSASLLLSWPQDYTVSDSSSEDLTNENGEEPFDTTEPCDDFINLTTSDDTWSLTAPFASMVFSATQKQIYRCGVEFQLTKTLISPDLEQRQLLHIFTFSIAPTAVDQLAAAGAAVYTHGTWLARLPALTGTNKLLDNAVRAVTIAHLGRLESCNYFLSKARPFYGKALRLLSLALADPIESLSAEVLGATILLSLYEMFASNRDDSWLRHAGGAAALMRIRGAARHRHGFHQELYLAYRHTLIIEAARSRVHCFLEEPEWREVAEQMRGNVENCQGARQAEHFNAAHDFSAEYVLIPGLICDAANLKLSPGCSYGTGISMKRKITTRAEVLRANIKRIFARLTSTLRSLGQGPTSYASDDPIFPIYYHYPNIFVASLHNSYRAMLMLLNIVLREMDLRGPSAGLHQLETRGAALDCCRSECFMLQSAFIGPFSSINTLRLALVLLEPVKEREWVWRKLSNITATKMSMMGREFPRDFAKAPLLRIRVAVEELDRVERMSFREGVCPQDERLEAHLRPQEGGWRDSLLC